MKLCVIGTGYVGLVAGAGFADFGNEVTCVDIDEAKIARLERGEVPIFEPGLEELVHQGVRDGRLRFSTRVAESAAGAEVVFFAVGTPPTADGGADLGFLLRAADEVARALRSFTVLVTKSTVPVGTGDLLRERIARATSAPFAVVSNPEFLKEGDAVNDFMKPDRIIVGTPPGPDGERARDVLRHLYAPFVRTNDRMLFMDVRSAELTKYAANSFLATRISFMNEIANLCERLGADVELVRRGMGSDPRIGAKFLFPGVGFGGSCFPKDLRALLATAAQHGADLGILDAVYRVNERQKVVLADKIAAHFGAQGLRGRTVAVWGLAFKPRTDDIREAPALALIDKLLARGARVAAHDPVAIDAVRRQLGDRIAYCDNAYDALRGADALALMTEWHEFRRPSFPRIKELLAQPVIFDGRNVWDPDELRDLGFTYYGIGRGDALPALAAASAKVAIVTGG